MKQEEQEEQQQEEEYEEEELLSVGRSWLIILNCNYCCGSRKFQVREITTTTTTAAAAAAATTRKKNREGIGGGIPEIVFKVNLTSVTALVKVS